MFSAGVCTASKPVQHGKHILMQHCTTQITVKPTQLQVYHLTTLIHCIKHNTLYGMYYLVSLKIRFLTACQLNLAETSIN